MTKTERKTLGDAADDTAPVIHYGPTEINFDINRGYVQPIWLCIDTDRWRKFGCREMRQVDRRFGPQGKMDLEKVDAMMNDVKAGVNTSAIGRKYGVSDTTVKYYAQKQGVKVGSGRGNFRYDDTLITRWADTVQTVNCNE